MESAWRVCSDHTACMQLGALMRLQQGQRSSSFKTRCVAADCAVHRDLRDEHACALKYGKDWDRYCSIVKYRIVPFLY